MAEATDEDIKAGFTELLMGVAVHHGEQPRMDVPWADVGSAGFFPVDSELWLRHVPGWESGKVDYAFYLVPMDEYQPLHEMGIRGPEELDCEEFIATPDEVEKVRAVMADQDGDDHADRSSQSSGR
jgi:hypothetical protein